MLTPQSKHTLIMSKSHVSMTTPLPQLVLYSTSSVSRLLSQKWVSRPCRPTMHRTKRLSRDHRHGPTSVHDRVLPVGHPHSVSPGVSGSNHNIAVSSSCETDRFLFTRYRWTILHFHYRWDCYVGAKSWLFLEPLLSRFAVDVPMQWYMTRVLFGCPYFGDIFIKERDQKL